MHSAGLVPYRMSPGGLEILIAHPGGPFWSGKQAGAWTIVKGEVPFGEDPIHAALREFAEETGWRAHPTDLIELGEVTQKAGKTIVAWAFEADFDPDTLDGDSVSMTWRGREITFPEIDQVRWCGRSDAEHLLNPAQAVYYERLNSVVAAPS